MERAEEAGAAVSEWKPIEIAPDDGITPAMIRAGVEAYWGRTTQMMWEDEPEAAVRLILAAALHEHPSNRPV